jgi:hypothetical protein
MSNLVSGAPTLSSKAAGKSLMHFVIKSSALARAPEKMSTASSLSRSSLHKLSHAHLFPTFSYGETVKKRGARKKLGLCHPKAQRGHKKAAD